MRPKSVVLEPWKKPQVHEKKFFRKKILAYLCRYDLQNGVRKFFLNKWVSRYLWFWKIALHNKIINKTQSTKRQENSAHRFVDNYLSNYHEKFLQDRIKPWKVGALRICTGYHFFLKKIASEGSLTCFNISCFHVNNSH